MRTPAFGKMGGYFKRRTIASASGLSLLLIFGQTAPLLGNPTGGNVVAGNASIAGAGNTLTINQSSNAAIINWQQFSIAHGETTQFVVPSSAAATLNRVTGGNASAIYGTLSSNGKVFLVNPSGILVGPTGRIDTHGFLASTLDISNDEFMKGGDLHFTGTSDASVENQGVIHSASGDVYLIAKQVINEGTLSAPHGNVGLAAGTDVLFQQAGDQHLFVQATPTSAKRANGVTNAGTIRAASAELRAAGGNAYALAINNTGVVAVTGFKKVNGQVYLTSDGGNITNSGKIIAKTANGDGGKIVLNGHGSSSSGTVLNSGQLIASGKATGKKGGSVQVLGNKVGITDSGIVDVSGNAGGGTALIGGDIHGANPAIVNADQTYLGPDAQVIADALLTGDGGKIVLWGDQSTQVYGKISAKGGSTSGNGGFVETSAPLLDVQTAVNVGSPHGIAGTWLLDPTDVTITDNASTTTNVSNSPPFTLIGNFSTATINQADILTALQSGNVTIDASQGTSGGAGTITWMQPNATAFDIASISGNTLTLNAPVQITLSGVVISNSGSGSLNITLNNSLTGAGSVQVLSSNINTGGGNFIANGNGYVSAVDQNYGAAGVNVSLSIINAGGGSIDLAGYGGYNSPGSSNLNSSAGVYINNGSVITTAGTGNISLQGYYEQLGDPNVTFASGVDIESGNNILSVAGGSIHIVGTVTQTYGNDSVSSQATAVEIGQGTIISATAAGGSIVIAGDASGSVAYDAGDGQGGSQGVDIGGGNSPTLNPADITTGNGDITITGQGGTIHTNTTTFSPFHNAGTSGIGFDEAFQVSAGMSGNLSITGAAGSVVVDSGNINTNAFGVSIFNQGKVATYSSSIASQAGSILIQGTGGNSPNLGIGVVLGGVAQPGGGGQGLVTVESTSGNIQIIGDGGAGNIGSGSYPGFYQPNHGIGIINGVTVSTGGALTLIGQGSGAAADGVAVTMVTDPNFDTAPLMPDIIAGTLNVNTFGGTGVDIESAISSSAINFNVPNADLLVTGPITTSQLSIASANEATVISDSGISSLGAINTSGPLAIFTNSALTINSTVTSSSYILIDAFNGDLTIGNGGKVVASGAGTSVQLASNQYFVNASSSKGNAIQVSNGAVYYIYSADPSATQLNGLAPTFTVFNTTFPATTFPSGNTLFYASSGTNPNPPNTNPNDNLLADDGGKNQAISTVTTQNGQVAPKQPLSLGLLSALSGSPYVPFSYTGNGMFGQVGGPAGDLANSSSNGGMVGSGDAAQLSRGELNNVNSPAAQGSLNLALSAFVRSALANALSSFADNDSPSHGKAVTGGDDNSPDGKHSKKKAVASNKEKDLDSGEVAVIGGNTVQNIPLGQAPSQLQSALDDSALQSFSGGAGH